MTLLKDATFESNAITGSDAYTSSTGSPTVASGSLIKGTYAARHNWTASTNVNGTVSGLNAGELWYSFYIRVAAYPAATARIIRASNGSTQYNITMTTAGALNLRMNATSLQTSVATLSLNTTYRIGLHIKVSTAAGNADSVVDMYVATGDTAFGAASYSNSAVTMNTTNANFSSLIFGHDNGAATTGDIYFDNIRIDDVSMPAADGGATDTPRTVSLTVTDTITKSSGIGYIRSITITDTLAKSTNVAYIRSKTVTDTVAKSTNIAYIKSITVVDTITATIVKAYIRTMNVTVNISSLIVRDILRLLSIPITVTVVSLRNISKIFTVTVSSIVDTLREYSRGILVTLSVNTAITRQNDIGKLTQYVVTTTSAIQRFITLAILYNSMVVIDITRAISITKEFIVNSLVAFSKQLLGTINIFFHKNTRNIRLSLKNTVLYVLSENTKQLTLAVKGTALYILGKNTRNIDL